jgi:DNA uptake protein ComE-like DNA-binding protein
MAGQGENPAQTGHDAQVRAAQSLAFLVGTGLCLALALGFAVGTLRRGEAAAARPAPERINPNEAPVASLMRLPQIGAARARAIVICRQSVRGPAGRQPAFRTADDLQQIRGIGPAIVEDVRPWLRFEDEPPDANETPTQ